MLRQGALLAILAWLSGCYVGSNEGGAETKFRVGGEEQSDIETFYVATIAAGLSETEKIVNDSQTIFLTRLDYNYAAGKATVKVKTVDKHGAVSSECDELTMINSRSGSELLPDGSRLSAIASHIPHTDEGYSAIRFVATGRATFRGSKLVFSIANSTVRVSEEMAHAGGEQLAASKAEFISVTSVTGGSQTYRDYMESIQSINGGETYDDGFSASTGLLTEDYLNGDMDNNTERLRIGNVPLSLMSFWQDAFSNCSSGSQTNGGGGS